MTVMPEQGVSDGAERVSIIIDHREKRTRTYDWLKTYDTELIERQLDVADYVVSDRVGIERKTVEDFLQSVINQRLFRQMEELSGSFERPLLILEGNPKMLFVSRGMHPNSIHGVLSSITLDYGVPIIWTHSPRVTAAQIFWTGHREQLSEKRGVSVRACKKTKGEREHQEFLVAGLPDINSKLGRRLLEHFGTVKKVFGASEERLMKVDGVGKKKARRIFSILNSDYRGQDEKVKGKTERNR